MLLLPTHLYRLPALFFSTAFSGFSLPPSYAVRVMWGDAQIQLVRILKTHHFVNLKLLRQDNE
jgi:hypothetical protein